MVGVVTIASAHVISHQARRAITTDVGRWLFGLALGVYFFTAGGSLTTTDAVVAFDVTRNIVEKGTLATSGNLLGLEAFRGADGRYYSPFGILQSIYNIPFYVAGTRFRGGDRCDGRQARQHSEGGRLARTVVDWRMDHLADLQPQPDGHGR